MTDEQEPKKQAEADKKSRSQATMPYPYTNLNSGLEVARVIHEKGGGECSAMHLASFLSYTNVRGGAFVSRISAAKQFGLIIGGQEALSVTERAMKILAPVMPEDGIQAKLDAFMEVPLFKDVFERFKGKSLPPEGGLKNLFANTYRLSPDRVGPAVRVFYESAEQAGLFELSPDRTQLLPPLIKRLEKRDDQQEGELPPPPPDKPPQITKQPEHNIGIHPALAGLLKDLPPPGPWEAAKKQQFMDAFRGIFEFVYPGKESP